ncbi:MAG: CPBP family intramembrane metalloprotease, partial [Acidobacteriota bacterium]|nr:CPBP family intramembrane metalloprotease [Acidobacteriota bacterium]
MFSSDMFHWDLALILALLAIVVPWMGRRRIQQLMRMPETTKAERLALYASTIAFQWLVSAIVFWRITADRIPAWTLGLDISRPALTGAVAIGLAVVIFANQLYSLRRLPVTDPGESRVLIQLALKVFPQDNPERLAFFAVVVTVAICEEWIYRGFVQTTLRDWGGSAISGILGSALLFAGAHLYQGRRGLISTFAIGVIFSVVRFWTGSLVPSVAAHFVADLTAGYWSPSSVR